MRRVYERGSGIGEWREVERRSGVGTGRVLEDVSLSLVFYFAFYCLQGIGDEREVLTRC